MKTITKILALSITLILCSSFSPSNVFVNKWVKLGTQKVNYKIDKDVIRVGLKKGSFTKLKVQVDGNLNMHKMLVEYGNGTFDNIKLKHNFIKGKDSRVIDLEGKNRVIKDITFWYDTKNYSRKKATVKIFGRK